jgi:predicted PurR-regulated permease PerM
VQVLVATVVGLVIWIVLWALNVKAFDSFMLAIAIVLGATVAWMVGPYVRSLFKP